MTTPPTDRPLTPDDAPGQALVPAEQVTTERALQTMPAFTPDQIQLIKNTIAVGATDDELALFVQQAQRTGLDPFSRQIWAWKQQEKLIIMTSIDGLRLIAERTGEYEGQRGPFWCSEDGDFKDVWLDAGVPVAARVDVFRRGHREPMSGTAHYSTAVRKNRQGAPNAMWSDRPIEMLAKCAESIALRRAFPNELSGIYTDAEMPEDAQRSAPPARQVRGPRGGRARPAAPAAEQSGRGSSRDASSPAAAERDASQQQGVTDVASLLRYASREYQWQPPDVCHLFEVDVISKLAPVVQERFGGDFSAAAREIDNYVIRGEQAAGRAEPDDAGDVDPAADDQGAAAAAAAADAPAPELTDEGAEQPPLGDTQ